MSIYTKQKSAAKKRINYRKIYEAHHGPIPTDKDGRRLEVHHIDGNHANNQISNLMLVTIHEHYAIHKSQGDVEACHAIALRLELTPAELSVLAKNANAKRIQDGTHNWLGGATQRQRQLDKVADGTHPWLGPDHNKKMIANGTHPLAGPENNRRRNKKMIEEGTHPLVGGDVQRKNNAERIKNKTHNLMRRSDGSSQAGDMVNAGTHPWLGSKNNEAMLAAGTHPSQHKKSCPHCGKLVSPGMYARWHGDNCSSK